jgi:hypothetical protein
MSQSTIKLIAFKIGLIASLLFLITGCGKASSNSQTTTTETQQTATLSSTQKAALAELSALEMKL